jgi:hypothetical protein
LPVSSKTHSLPSPLSTPAGFGGTGGATLAGAGEVGRKGGGCGGEGNGGRVGGAGGGTATSVFSLPSCFFVFGLAKRSGVSRAAREELLEVLCPPSLGSLSLFAEGAVEKSAPCGVSWGAATWFGEGSAEDGEGGVSMGEPGMGGDVVTSGERVLVPSEAGLGEAGLAGTGAGGEGCEEEEGGEGVVGTGGCTP